MKISKEKAKETLKKYIGNHRLKGSNMRLESRRTLSICNLCPHIIPNEKQSLDRNKKILASKIRKRDKAGN